MIYGGNIISMNLPDQKFWKKSGISSDLNSLNYAKKVFEILKEGSSVKMTPKVPTSIHSGENPPSLVFKTSGTSGDPKQHWHSWDGLMSASLRLKAFLNNDKPVDTICCLPIHHVGGWMQVARAWFLGGSVIFIGYKDLAKSEKVQLCENRYLSLVPTQLFELLKSKDAVANLRKCNGIFIGGAHCSSEISQKAREAKLPIYICYGMTETAGMVTVLEKDDFANGITGVGQTMPGVSMRLDQEGRICIKCPSLSLNFRYADSSDCEWFKTSDLGEEENGYWQVVHRIDRVINTGGEKVIPDFIEKNILEFPSVESCFVTSSKDEKWGQKIVAYISPQSVDRQRLKELLSIRLQKFEIPKEFFLSENLDAVKGVSWKR